MFLFFGRCVEGFAMSDDEVGDDVEEEEELEEQEDVIDDEPDHADGGVDADDANPAAAARTTKRKHEHKPGIIYLSRIPGYMGPPEIRTSWPV